MSDSSLKKKIEKDFRSLMRGAKALTPAVYALLWYNHFDEGKIWWVQYTNAWKADVDNDLFKSCVQPPL